MEARFAVLLICVFGLLSLSTPQDVCPGDCEAFSLTTDEGDPAFFIQNDGSVHFCPAVSGAGPLQDVCEFLSSVSKLRDFTCENEDEAVSIERGVIIGLFSSSHFHFFFISDYWI